MGTAKAKRKFTGIQFIVLEKSGGICVIVKCILFKYLLTKGIGAMKQGCIVSGSSQYVLSHRQKPLLALFIKNTYLDLRLCNRRIYHRKELFPSSISA